MYPVAWLNIVCRPAGSMQRPKLAGLTFAGRPPPTCYQCNMPGQNRCATRCVFIFARARALGSSLSAKGQSHVRHAHPQLRQAVSQSLLATHDGSQANARGTSSELYFITTGRFCQLSLAPRTASLSSSVMPLARGEHKVMRRAGLKFFFFLD